MEDVNAKIKEVSKLNNIIKNNDNKINDCELTIKNINKTLRKYCNHEWKREDKSHQYDITYYSCIYCQTLKKHYFYDNFDKNNILNYLSNNQIKNKIKNTKKYIIKYYY